MLLRKQVALIGAGVLSAAAIASPTGAATTAWTSAHLTAAVKSMQHSVASDNRRDVRQGRQITSLTHRVTYLGTTNVKQNGRLNQLSALVAGSGTRLTAIEAARPFRTS